MKGAFAGLMFATSVAMAPPVFAQATAPAELNEHVLPVAAGALVGAAASFFLLPLLVPTMAVAATTGVSVTSGPVVAVVGAGIGGILGYELVR